MNRADTPPPPEGPTSGDSDDGSDTDTDDDPGPPPAAGAIAAAEPAPAPEPEEEVEPPQPPQVVEEPREPEVVLPRDPTPPPPAPEPPIPKPETPAEVPEEVEERAAGEDVPGPSSAPPPPPPAKVAPAVPESTIRSGQIRVFVQKSDGPEEFLGYVARQIHGGKGVLVNSRRVTSVGKDALQVSFDTRSVPCGFSIGVRGIDQCLGHIH